jgi:hypothetical protein
MPIVLCEVSKGLRPSEVTVAVKDTTGRSEYLRVERDFLIVDGEKSYITIGVVHDDKARGVMLIELPHEADSGHNRLWVPREHVRFLTRTPA